MDAHIYNSLSDPCCVQRIPRLSSAKLSTLHRLNTGVESLIQQAWAKYQGVQALSNVLRTEIRGEKGLRRVHAVDRDKLIVAVPRS